MPENFTEMKYPVAIRWIFDKEFFNECGENERVKSHRYQLPGFPVTYYLTIDYEQEDDDDPNISMKLNCYCDYNDIEIEADFKIVAKLFYEKHLSEEKFKETKCKFDDKINEIECYAVEEWKWYSEPGDIVFSLKGTFTIKELPIIPLSIRVPKINQEMYGENDKKDFTIVSGGQEIKVHKSILQQVSPVFGRMLDSENWKETSEAKMDLSFLPFELTKIIMDSFYGKKHWGFLDKNEYIQIFQFADQYDITPLKNAIKNCIILTPQNVVEYANLTIEAKCEELTNYCIENLFTCNQYSIPIKDIEKLSNDVKLLIAEQVFLCPLLKRKIEDENITRNDRDNYIEKSEMPKPQVKSKNGNSRSVEPAAWLHNPSTNGPSNLGSNSQSLVLQNQNGIQQPQNQLPPPPAPLPNPVFNLPLPNQTPPQQSSGFPTSNFQISSFLPSAFPYLAYSQSTQNPQQLPLGFQPSLHNGNNLQQQTYWQEQLFMRLLMDQFSSNQQPPPPQ